MTALIGAVIIVGLLCLLDLLLTLGTIRRLREHTMIIGRIRPGGYPVVMGVTALADGASPQPFTAVTTDGVDVTGPAGLSVVGFFSTTCPACPERAPAFTDYLRSYRPGTRDESLVVVIGETDDPPSYLAALAEVAHVCTEAEGGPISLAFGLQAFPAFFVLDAGGNMLTSSYDPAELPAAAPV